MKTVLFIIHTDDQEKIEFAKKFSQALLKKGADVELFLMSKGVKFAYELKAFVDKISLCSRNAQELEINEIQGIDFASQYRLSEMVQDSDLIIPLI